MFRWAAALFLTTASYASAQNFHAILNGSGQDYALAVTTDAAGNVYTAGLTYSPDFRVTSNAFQTKLGNNYACDAFVAKFAPDGTLVWSTYLGGGFEDWATGIAVDAAGNVVVTGWTRSADFPLVAAAQTVLNNGGSLTDFDAFVAKLDPAGGKLLYSTFLGGEGHDGANGLALDAAGNAYICGQIQSSKAFPGLPDLPNRFGVFVAKLDPKGALVYTYYRPNGTANGIAVDSGGNAYVAGSMGSTLPAAATTHFGAIGSLQAMAFQISPDGSRKLWETTLGGSDQANATSIAVDRSGAVFLAGYTTSPDFPLLRPLQSTSGARPLWKSTDGGATWAPLDDVPFAVPQDLVADPTAPNTLYAGTADRGIYKSSDGGVTWNAINQGIGYTNMQHLAIDPAHPQTLYAAPNTGVSGGVVYKTADGGNSWAVVDRAPAGVSQLAVDPQNPSILWEVGAGTTRKSVDAGATWNNASFPGTSIASLVLDPHASGNVVAFSQPILVGPHPGNVSPYLYRSTDGGANWTKYDSPAPGSAGLFIDGSTNPSTVYNGLGSRSSDAGVTWSVLPSSPVTGGPVSGVTIDPNGTLYAFVYGSGVLRSRDRAETWTGAGSPVPAPIAPGLGLSVSNMVAVGSTGTLYAAINLIASSGFVSKLSPGGKTLEYSTYLRSHPGLDGHTSYLAEPDVFGLQTWISSLALDASGNLVVAGGVRGADLPTVNAAQPKNAGLADAFVSVIAADGQAVLYSTYYGGSQDDAALALAVGSNGEIVIAGDEWSRDFPGGVPQPVGYSEAFVTRLTPSRPVITAVVDGASFRPAIVSGSWVTIRGTNLAGTVRSWRTDEIVNGVLPTSLDGVGVAIDGKPAFVAYISATQINVQAPSDSVTGPVQVVVTNNGSVSSAATVQLQPFAPAFFQFAPTPYAVATRLPGYVPVGDPAEVPGAVAAQLGDVIVLWGTGFGPTNPTTPAGLTVSRAPAAASTPVVTVGGVPAEVLNTVLTTGTAGLYQITIRIPPTAPAGKVVVQASVGGAASDAGTLLFIR